MNITLKLNKGLDLKLEGGIKDSTAADAAWMYPDKVAITPDDFPGLVLKPCVKEGDEVQPGDIILHDKTFNDISICSPVVGVINKIVRGERRKLQRIEITVAQQETKANDNGSGKWDVTQLSAEDAAQCLQKSGLWAMMRQRPYDIVPVPGTAPRDIYVTTFDSAPLAPDYDDILSQDKSTLEAAVKFLSKLTSGTIYISRKAKGSIPDIAGATMIDITGPHPAGNAGPQIANTNPVNKGETVWCMDGMTLLRIGRYVLTGIVPTTCVVALTGSEIVAPRYIRTFIGADVKSLLEHNVKDTESHKRIISGNVLTGTAVGQDGYLRFPYRQITVIPEGDDVVEFMGWASLSPSKMSTSRSFPGHFLHKLFKPDARLLGGRRAMIMSGEYDRLLPMDIMTEYLVKAIISRDIEKMEQLGIYEIAPEDVALAEYACTSKMPLQEIVAQGLEYLRKELE